MKHLLLFAGLLLAGCSSSPTEKAAEQKPAENPTHQAVVGYLKKNLDDPASYQAARWGKIKPFQQRDVDIEKAGDLLTEYRSQVDIGKERSEHFIRMADLATSPTQGLAELNKAKRALALYEHRGDSIKRLSDKFRDSTDSTELGKVVVHAYRAKNKMGALELDSAVFTVYNSGKVEMQKY